MERPPWFAVTIPGDPRYASTIHGLVVRFAQNKGFDRADATEIGRVIDGAVRRVIMMTGSAAGGQRIKADLRAETAFEVVLTCEGANVEAAGVLADKDLQQLWDPQTICRVMDHVEVGRNGAASFCRMEKRLPEQPTDEPAPSAPKAPVEP